MTWRLEASGATGANLIVIQPIESDEDPTGKIKHVRIRITPTGGHEHPTMPIWPPGIVYRHRDGLEFTILRPPVVEERGGEDGESSIWTFDYLALWGAHDLTRIQA
jgi:hypothetical protein